MVTLVWGGGKGVLAEGFPPPPLVFNYSEDALAPADRQSWQRLETNAWEVRRFGTNATGGSMNEGCRFSGRYDWLGCPVTAPPPL